MGVLLVFGSVLHTPGVLENMLVDLALVTATVVTLVLMPIPWLTAGLRVVVPVVAVAVIAGTWNSWHLAAVNSLFGHPVLAGDGDAFVATFDPITLDELEPPTFRSC